MSYRLQLSLVSTDGQEVVYEGSFILGCSNAILVEMVLQKATQRLMESL